MAKPQGAMPALFMTHNILTHFKTCSLFLASINEPLCLGPGDLCNDLSALNFLPCQLSRTHWHGNLCTVLSLEDRLTFAFPVLALSVQKKKKMSGAFVRGDVEGAARVGTHTTSPVAYKLLSHCLPAMQR